MAKKKSKRPAFKRKVNNITKGLKEETQIDLEDSIAEVTKEKSNSKIVLPPKTRNIGWVIKKYNVSHSEAMELVNDLKKNEE